MEKTQFNEIASKMPGSFKSKLERIRRFLYLDSASVMVGAGFSLNADVPSHIKVKQWSDVGIWLKERWRNIIRLFVKLKKGLN